MAGAMHSCICVTIKFPYDFVVYVFMAMYADYWHYDAGFYTDYNHAQGYMKCMLCYIITPL